MPNSNVLPLSCALLQPYRIELCLIPMAHKRIVPYSYPIELNCALFQCLINELCLIPTLLNCIVPISNPTKLNFAYFQHHQIELCQLIPTRFVRALWALPCDRGGRQMSGRPMSNRHMYKNLHGVLQQGSAYMSNSINPTVQGL